MIYTHHLSGICTVLVKSIHTVCTDVKLRLKLDFSNFRVFMTDLNHIGKGWHFTPM